MDSVPQTEVVDILNKILEIELAGVVRYTHYSLMVFGHARIPIVSWMRTQATEALDHASAAGEYVTALGGHPSLSIGRLLETHRHDIDQGADIGAMARPFLLKAVEGKSVVLEEYARKMVHDEEAHVMEIEKMLRKPGKLEPVR